MARQQELMMKRMQDDDGFIAALDQSGGSSKCTILQSQTTASQTNANDHSFSISLFLPLTSKSARSTSSIWNPR
jgi:fructose-bisphosphate aldolase class 1